MAFLRYAVNVLSSTILKVAEVPKTLKLPSFVPARSKQYWVDARMERDYNRRQTVKKYAKLRLQINAIRYNTILPKKLQEIADKEIAALPSNSCLTKTHPRCILTSRARGRWRAFRMSRIVWRNLADYNKISGAERAMWGWS